MKNQPLLLPLVGLIAGIVWTEWSVLSISIQTGFIVFGVLVLIFLIFPFFKRYFSLFALVIFFMLGGIGLQIKSQFQKLPESILKQTAWVEFEVQETFKSSEKFHKYKAELIRFNGQNTPKIGVLLYVKDRSIPLNSGDMIKTETQILPLQKSLNPYSFDYSRFLNRRGIYYSSFVEQMEVNSPPEVGFVAMTSRLKRRWHKDLLSVGYSKAVADQIGAMLLGDRTEMDKETEVNYRKTGVVHILAISGLHVMMVYGLIFWLLYPLQSLKNGRFFRIGLSLFLIWLFAAFVGFHPPVSRSALMISVFHLSVAFGRKPNVYHSLMLSALALLVVNPMNLFEVGFQLSFSAVFFIVYLNPIFERLIRPKNSFSRTATAFVGTSVSAQLGTLPFSVFYFHQTSALFLLGNVVMIPAAFGMIVGGMVSLLLTSLSLNFPIWVTSFNFFIETCNAYIAYLATHRTWVFDQLYFSVFEVFILLTFLVLIRFLILQFSIRYLAMSLTLVLIFEIHRNIELYKMNQKQEVIVFHQNKNTLIGIRNGRTLDLFVGEFKDTLQLVDFVVKPYLLHEKLKYFKWHSLDEYADFVENSKTDSSNQIAIITENLKFENGKRFRQIVIDGSNYPNFQLDSTEIPIWITRNEGAFIQKIR